MALAPRLFAALLGSLFLLLLSGRVPVYASVGLEYLGPYPFQPRLVGENTLEDQGVVGNSGDEPARVNFSLNADDEFRRWFTVAFSDNNLTLNPGERKSFTVTFTFRPDAPAGDHSASISIVAEALNIQPGTTPGRASFNLAVIIRSKVMPEFPSGMVFLFASMAVVFLLARRFSKLTNTVLVIRAQSI